MSDLCMRSENVAQLCTSVANFVAMADPSLRVALEVLLSKQWREFSARGDFDFDFDGRKQDGRELEGGRNQSV